MQFFKYPHTDLNAQNQNWLIQQMRQLIAEYTRYENPVVIYLREDMTDTTKIYIYQGNETGMENAHWYYYNVNTNAWIDGGPYAGGPSLPIDATLSLAGHPADAKVVGDRLTAISNRLSTINVRSYSITLDGTVSEFNITAPGVILDTDVVVAFIPTFDNAFLPTGIKWNTNTPGILNVKAEFNFPVGTYNIIMASPEVINWEE